MATATPHGIASQTLTLEEYLNTSYRPDCDFVDDHIEERNLGNPKHALLQMELGLWFGSRRKAWKVRVMGDVRTRTRQTRVRLPDVAAMREEEMDLEEKAMTSPPLLPSRSSLSKTVSPAWSSASKSSPPWAFPTSGSSTPSNASPTP